MTAQSMQITANTVFAATASNGLLAWVTDHASAITAIVSVVGVFATCIFYGVSLYLKIKENEINRQKLNQDQDDEIIKKLEKTGFDTHDLRLAMRNANPPE